MLVSPVNLNKINNNNCLNKTEAAFGHGINSKESPYSAKQKAIITATSTLGVLASIALLAKHAGYSLKPSKMFKNIKKSYLATADFEAKEVIAMGAGSCLGGLAGGYIVDKNKDNRRAKRRETIMQMGNVSIPILTVALLIDKIFKNKSKGFKAIAGLAGVGIGVALSNIIMNKLNNYIFDEGKNDGRKMKVTDFSAHLDDVVVAAHYISKADWVHAIGRLVPAALVIPGLEIGHKTAD